MPKHPWDSLLLTTVGLVPFSLVPLPPAIATSPPAAPRLELSTSHRVHVTAIAPSTNEEVEELAISTSGLAIAADLPPSYLSQPLVLVASPPAPTTPEKPTNGQPPTVPSPTSTPAPAPASTPPPTSTNQPAPVATPTPPVPDSSPESKPTPDTPASDPKAKPAAEDAIVPIKSAAEIERQKQLAEADRLYRAGDTAAAEKIYRLIKTPFAAAPEPLPQPEPITDAELLSPSGKVFWRESTIGLEQKMESRIFVPLQLLTEKIPQFIPGHLRLAQALTERGKPDQALAVLEKAAGLYPNQPELLKARITALAQNEKWMEAAIAARQFALLNPESPLAPEFTTLAEENQKRYQQHMRRKLNSNLVGGIITGALSYALTGSLYGPFNAVQATALMLRGESAVGDRVTKQAKRQLVIVEDSEVVEYVNEIGQKLTKVAGRNEFKYEFFVVMDDALNAFALPGGKVFVNLGAIAKTNSEAELAGLLAHELSHAVLSHGFQLMTQGTLTANVTQFIPYVGGLAGDLLVLNYSRDMERQADTMGTRILASADYAADGLRNLMVTLQQQESKKGKNSPPEWASSHPATPERVRYLETLIITGSYNRYAFEGVERHAAMQAKVEKMLKDHKAEEEAKQKK